MQTHKIAFVVGHANWGKSKTLRALTNDDFRIRRTTIKKTEFFIRRMSNDDQPAGYIKFMSSLNPTAHPYLIAALCPNFTDPNAATKSTLKNLKDKGYQLFFWVIEHQFGTSNSITTSEINSLKQFGTVEVYTQKSEAHIRATKFKEFVSKQLCT